MRRGKLAARSCSASIKWLPLLALAPFGILGAELHGNISADSEITMIIKKVEGSPETLKLTSVDSQTLIALVREGKEFQAAMPHEECLSLWQFCFDRRIEELKDARPHPSPPDLAEFTLSFRIESTSHRFTVYGVEFIPDTRYREIVREILKVCSRYLPDVGS